MKRIVSRQNPCYVRFQKLFRSARERRRTGLLLLDGTHLVESYAQHYRWPQEILVSETGLQRPEIAALVQGLASSTRITCLADALFHDLSTVETPTGILAIAAQPPVAQLDTTADTVLLDGIQDPGNVGSILRSAAAAGFRQVLLSADCVQVWSPKVLRAAMGAHFVLQIQEDCELIGFLGAYQGRSVAAMPGAQHDLFAADLAGPLAWIFGNEGQGVRAPVAQAAGLEVSIELAAGSDSLNVAAAAAICLFETKRRRCLDRGPRPISPSRRER